MMSVASCIPFPFFASRDAFLTMLACATRWLSMHLYMLTYMSMHESCLLVCPPYFNTMNLWTLDPNLHLSPVDTTFCLLSCLFVLPLVCLHPCFYACHAHHDYPLYAFSYALCNFSFHGLSASFLSLLLHVQTWSEDAWSQGIVTQAQVKRARMQACGDKPCNMFNRFRSLAFPFWLCTFLLGISCHVPFVLISRVWRPLFIFLHLYFWPCSRDVGIYFPALCACIVHDVCIYIPVHPFRCDCHSPCHLRQSDA